MRSEGDSRRVHGIATRLPRKALPLAFGTLVERGECVRLRSPSDGRPEMFAVVCQHCHATVLTTPRIRRSEEDQLAALLTWIILGMRPAWPHAWHMRKRRRSGSR